MARKNFADLDTLPSPSTMVKATLLPNQEKLGLPNIRVASDTYGRTSPECAFIQSDTCDSNVTA
jgi:hypothetical protein